MKVRRLSKRQKQKIVKMLGQGIPCKIIAIQMGTSLQTVYYTGWRIGIKGKWGQSEKFQRDTKIRNELKQGIACKDIAVHFNISVQTVYRIKRKEQSNFN